MIQEAGTSKDVVDEVMNKSGTSSSAISPQKRFRENDSEQNSSAKKPRKY